MIALLLRISWHKAISGKFETYIITAMMHRKMNFHREIRFSKLVVTDKGSLQKARKLHANILVCALGHWEALKAKTVLLSSWLSWEYRFNFHLVT